MKILLTLAVLLIANTHVFATWSIIVIDQKTKEIGIAGASCTRNCYGIGEILPGVGAVIVQAMSNNQARGKGMEMILSGRSPEEIIKVLREPFYDPERQQYAIVSLRHFDAPATYTGTSTHDFGGTLTGPGFSVQGNTLTGENVLHEIYQAVQRGQREGFRIDRILMLALEAGARAGGDKRCGKQTATSAFITVARPGDKKPYLNLQIFGQRRGGPNAVSLLSSKYGKWAVNITKHNDR